MVLHALGADFDEDLPSTSHFSGGHLHSLVGVAAALLVKGGGVLLLGFGFVAIVGRAGLGAGAVTAWFFHGAAGHLRR
jgi:hypothetical protein